jgi:hypothetical protein
MATARGGEPTKHIAALTVSFASFPQVAGMIREACDADKTSVLPRNGAKVGEPVCTISRQGHAFIK